MQKIDTSNFSSSTKVEAALKVVKDMLHTDKTHKAIVFSQYTRMLDIVEWRFVTSGIRVVKLMGYMPLKERQSVLNRFRTDPNVPVILMSLKAGGEGLNLQEASHVMCLDPWWNPAVEAQAINRAHRIGQTRPVTAIRFITKNSIEERMLQLQEKKKLVFEGTVDGSAAALSQLTTEDLQFLFR
jgi:DNA repair protein RAD16